MTALSKGQFPRLAAAALFAMTLAACRWGGGGSAPTDGTDHSPAAQQVRVGDRVSAEGDIVNSGTSKRGTLNGVEGTFTCAPAGCALRTSGVSGSDVRTVTGVDGITFTPSSSVQTGNPQNRPPAGTADKAETAARSVPNGGSAGQTSVTQSSNSWNGGTADSVSTTVVQGGSGFAYSVRNGSKWSIGDDDTVVDRVAGTAFGRSFHGVELRKGLASGTLYADIHSTWEAASGAWRSQRVARLGTHRSVEQRLLHGQDRLHLPWRRGPRRRQVGRPVLRQRRARRQAGFGSRHVRGDQPERRKPAGKLRRGKAMTSRARIPSRT